MQADTTNHTPPDAQASMTSAGFAWRGLAEAIAILAICLTIDIVFGQGNRFSGMEPHPFGIAVLLAAAQYGVAEATAAAALASIALFAFNLPAQSFDQDRLAWLTGLARDPLIWFATALLVGGIAGRVRARARDAEVLTQQRESELSTVVSTNAKLSERVKALEARIAGQQRTVTAVYEAARSMGPSRNAVLRGALTLLRATVGATCCSVYSFDGVTLTLEATDGDGTDAGEPVRSVGYGALFEALVGRQRTLVVTRPEDLECLSTFGIMAGPVLTPEGSVAGALVIHTLPLTQLHFGAVANFRAICAWVGAELEHATQFEAAGDERFLVEGSNLISARHADRLLEIMAATARRIGFDLSLMQIELVDESDGISQEVRQRLLAILETVFRNTDILLEHDQRGRVRVLMPGTPLRNAPLVAKRLHRAAEEQDTMLLPKLHVSWVSLHEPKPQALAA